jgi:hypothetical protein
MIRGTLVLVAKWFVLIIKSSKVPENGELFDSSFFGLSRCLFFQVVYYDLRE